ncbi:IclR family transcriptional regulator [Leekyejoonella antrihumi]|uniref:IclR family transcriptional regulator n=1 Tax=Leekyejoonella antrihumi TaxID=1660198 RepID=A0A563E9C4_9MICO|nr:IclR family transcriptional regulator [Leekyejoonella antrihumi]TWP38853.1 IclR family transcriptional regulator [Leekyejoonella antrihumi]
MPRYTTTSAGAPGASVIENTVAILRCFSPDRQLLGVTEIAKEVGQHKSTVSRTLASLEREGIVEQDATRRYRLGLGILTIAGPLLADLDVRRAGFPVLQRLTEATGETSALMVWNDTEAITVEQIPSPHQVKHTSSIGSRYRTALSASVQVFLAGDDPERVRQLLREGAVTGIGEKAVPKYLARLAGAAELGYAVNGAETASEEVGVAAPVRDHRGAIVAAVLIAAPRFRTDDAAMDELGKQCAAAASQVTLRLGGRTDHETER